MHPATDLDISAANQENAGSNRLGFYPWLVFALIFGLMLSDYQSRQVISSLFPLIRAEWGLSDKQLGGLVSVVALTVGIVTVPVSYLADRWGRVKSITAMALLWCLATVACGFAANYAQLFAARSVVGLGEAAYSSAGGALLAHVFPARRRATVFGLMLAGSLFGSVLGVVLGGAVSAKLGWRFAFMAAGAPGLALALAFPFLVKDYPSAPKPARAENELGASWADVLHKLFSRKAAIWAYIGSGLQMLPTSMVIAWTPSYLNRYYGLATDRAAIGAAVVILLSGVGMALCGAIVDRASQRVAVNRARLPGLISLVSGVLLAAAFALPPGPAALALLLAGGMLVGGHAGASSSIIIDTTDPGVRATALAMLILTNNILGLAPGPFLVGHLSDLFGLKTGLMLASCVAIPAAYCFMRCARTYEADRTVISDGENPTV